MLLPMYGAGSGEIPSARPWWTKLIRSLDMVTMTMVDLMNKFGLKEITMVMIIIQPLEHKPVHAILWIPAQFTPIRDLSCVSLIAGVSGPRVTYGRVVTTTSPPPPAPTPPRPSSRWTPTPRRTRSSTSSRRRGEDRPCPNFRRRNPPHRNCSPSAW